jgi:serralysin
MSDTDAAHAAGEASRARMPERSKHGSNEDPLYMIVSGKAHCAIDLRELILRWSGLSLNARRPAGSLQDRQSLEPHAPSRPRWTTVDVRLGEGQLRHRRIRRGTLFNNGLQTSTDYFERSDDGWGVILFGTFNGHFGDNDLTGTVSRVVFNVPFGASQYIDIQATFALVPSIVAMAEGGQMVALIQDIMSGEDTVYGALFGEFMNGYGGNDTLVGGPGGDTLDGGPGNDTASYVTARSGLFAGLEDTNTNSGDADGDVYISIDNLTGSRFNDILYGTAGANRLSGGLGNDVLCGKDGADTFDGGGGVDKVSYDASDDAVRVSLLNPSSNTWEALGDRYISIENIAGGSFGDHLSGNNLANTISGNNFPNLIVDHDRLFGLGGNDRLLGYMGDDDLTGGLGADQSTGGAGQDDFIFNSVAESSNASRDRIMDFVRAQGDRIVLSSIDANANAAGNQAFKFIGTAAFTGAGQLRYQKIGSDSHIQGDTNGDGVADRYIVSANPVSFVKGDFVL